MLSPTRHKTIFSPPTKPTKLLPIIYSYHSNLKMTQNNNFSLQANTCRPHVLDDLYLNDGLMELESFDLNTGDLSEWLDPQHDPDTTIDELPSFIDDMELDDCSFDEDMFRDCKEEIEDEDESAHGFSRQFRRESISPPQQRVGELSPEISSPCHQQSCETQPPPVYPQQTYLNPSTAPVTSSPVREMLYNTTLNNLTSSMKRSEISRAQVLGHRASVSNFPRQPSPGSMDSLPGLLLGKRTALTAGLEESRNQLRRYMSLINRNQLL